MTVAVIGAAGTIGPRIVESLVARGERPRVLTRDADRAKPLLPAEAEIRQVDIGDHDQIIAACSEVSSVLLLTAHSHDMADLQLRIVRALRRLDVSIVKVSGTSSAITPQGPYACRAHWEVETVLRDSGQPYVILRPNAFMQTLIGQILLPSVRATGTVPNPIAGAGISFIDGRDIGECAAIALTTDDWAGRTLVLTGPRPVTYAEITAVIGERTGRKVELQDITPADVRIMMSGRGTPLWEAEHFEEMYEMFRRGESEFVSGDVELMTGRPPRTVEDYLAETLDGVAS
ncbi:NmrA family NAD(P)-binding protein [Actinocorallia sp. A-T 12471]|uniref:NmrA family NAD(P)-binding protein n=1 Tax=Actinocorallia sp. A-T 12471 TaxID=3089813 RepID=UPI0029D1E88E|nr:NmrA family NAD(P)-binding protein [Actinocorallia sp. A-T 12471]MDX6739575.1 NAD(P)H-binding protein [Actinocorallia sp. A-T 12471]